MGREIRMVPANWNHPAQVGANGRIHFVALYEGNYSEAAAEYAEEKAKWDRGEFPDYASEDSRKMSYEEWNCGAPSEGDYMPEWKPEEKTHLMMYENTSEGTPISPAFATPEELARWLADNGASSFGRDTASYDAWLSTCKRGWAMSMAVIPGAGLISGVELNALDEAQ